MKTKFKNLLAFCLLLGSMFIFTPSFAKSPVRVTIKSSKDQPEVERLIRQILPMTAVRRVEFVSRYLNGRKYRPETKKRIKKQRDKKIEKREATNTEPLKVEFLRTSMEFLDCMTYVEHVLAIASCQKPDYSKDFLPRLLDIMFDAGGKPLLSHLRNHFTSVWADKNEKKGYLVNIARNHKLAKTRTLTLNQVGKNRTYYVEDRFMISEKPQTIWFFDRETLLSKKFRPDSGDVLAMVTDKEGLDVTHMGFYIKKAGKHLLRHASYTLNRVVDQDFYDYLREHKSVKGLMVLRPVLKASTPAKYNFENEKKLRNKK